MLSALLFASSYLPTEPCNTTVQVQRVHAAQRRLFQIPKPSDEEVFFEDEKVLPISTSAVPALRRALSAAVTSFMLCDAGSQSEPEAFESQIAALLGGETATAVVARKGEDGRKHVFGDVTVQAKWLAGLTGTLAVDVSFGIACGEDHMLLLFRKEDGKWTRTLEWRSRKYTGLYDAFGDFFSYLVVPGRGGKPALLVGHGMPWCTSNLSGFKVDLLPLDGSNRKPEEAEYGYRRWFEKPPELHAIPGGAVFYADADGHDIDQMMTFPAMFAWRTTRGKLERLPAAWDARAFSEQWLNDPWESAKRWTPHPDAKLEALHRRLNYEEKEALEDQGKAAQPAGSQEKTKEDEYEQFSYGPLQACRAVKNGPRQKNRVQVSFRISSDEPQKKTEELFVQIAQHGRFFQLLSVESEANPLCDGPDLKRLEQ